MDKMDKELLVRLKDLTKSIQDGAEELLYVSETKKARNPKYLAEAILVWEASTKNSADS